VYGGDFFAQSRSEWDGETLTERPRDHDGTHPLVAEAEERYRANPG
jgi:hypothetical protein